MSLAGTLCYQLAKRVVLTRRTGAAGENPHTFDLATYQQWREAELSRPAPVVLAIPSPLQTQP